MAVTAFTKRFRKASKPRRNRVLERFLATAPIKEISSTFDKDWEFLDTEPYVATGALGVLNEREGLGVKDAFNLQNLYCYHHNEERAWDALVDKVLKASTLEDLLEFARYELSKGVDAHPYALSRALGAMETPLAHILWNLIDTDEPTNEAWLILLDAIERESKSVKSPSF
jgi:hypothetical protein